MKTLFYDFIPEQLECLEIFKERFDQSGMEGIEPFADIHIDNDDIYSESIEVLFSIDELVSNEYIEEYETNILTFSSREMVKFYRLAYKISELSGWKKDENPHFDAAIEHDLEKLRRCEQGIFGEIYPNIRHNGYASSWCLEVTSEFYDYFGLVLAILDIFNRYAEKAAELQGIYDELCHATINNSLEVAV